MRPLRAGSGTFLALVLAVPLLAGCAASAGQPSPTAVAAAEPRAMVLPPTATPPPTPTPSATPTATPQPPTPTPSPTAGGAAALLTQVRGKQQDVKSARGLMEIAVEARQGGQPQSLTMAIEFAIAEPDAHMKMSSKGLPLAFDLEFIAKGDTAYMKMGDQWTVFPAGGKGELKTQMNLFDIDELRSFLGDASNVKLVGRRNVKGVECDIVSFTLSPEKMRELAALRGRASARQALDEDVQIAQFQGEVAIGAADKLLRQMVFKMSGYEKQQPEAKFDLSFTASLWDLNSPDIVIKPPEGAKPLRIPSPTGSRS